MKKVLVILVAAVTLAFGGVAVSATPFALSTQKAEAASYTSCFLSMDGRTWCWQYGCTYFETVVLGCRDGWVPMRSTWYA